jgi:alpha-tubulin suppressor-like RCC1 family protein
MARALVRAGAMFVLVVWCVPLRAGWMGTNRESPPVSIGPGSVAAGRAHTVVATPDGRVFAWGAGGRGQLGEGTLVDRWTPTLVQGLDEVIEVAAGAAHTVALKRNGEVYAWGANTFGRLGDGTRKRRPRPVRISGVTGVKRIAAGRAHTLALTEGGRVFTWGRNTSGQLGNGKKAASEVPVPVSGLTDIVSIAAGDDFSLAVTRGGNVFAWGSNEFSRLGDGTTKDRPKPVQIALTGVVSVAAGEAHGMALMSSGAVYTWGRGANGELGTGSTKVASTPRRVAGLQASFIGAGRHFSAAIDRDGQLVTWGANGSGQLGDRTTMRRLRPVVVDSDIPIATFALGDAHAIAVTTAGDVMTWGEGASGRLGNGSEMDQTAPFAVNDDSLDWGSTDEEPVPPDPPLISPPTGIYPAPQTVTLSATRDTDSIRFTLDGSEPNESSPLYGSPFLVSASATIVARSYSAEGESSAVRAATYTIDTSAPAITAVTSPPLGTGWMTVPVTVTFQCADDIGIASCSSPVTVAQDGAGQVITGTAVDRAGHQSTATVIVNLDLNPPVLAITAPQDQASVDAATVQITGLAGDVASGLAETRCNGEPAAVVGGGVQCTVQLHPGRNEIVLHAIDRAGHNASAAVSVMRTGATTRLMLTPATRAMVIDEITRLMLRDEFGVAVEQAVWSTSDEDVVTLSESDPPLLTAVGLGTVSITAEKNGRLATAEIVVSAGVQPGDIRWTLPALPGLTSEPPLFTNRVDASVPDMFAVETEDWDKATLRAVTSDGEVLWQQHSPGIPFMGDSFGGVLAGVVDDDGDYRAFLRLGGGTAPAWRLESAGALGRPAQSRAGTIYALEYLFGGINFDGDDIIDKHAVVIDGATGQLISRTRLAREVDEFVSDRDGDVIPTMPPLHCLTKHYEFAPETLGPVVGSDGRGYLLVRRHAVWKRGGCIEPFMTRAARTIDMGLDLVILSPNAAPVVVDLFSSRCDGAEAALVLCDKAIELHQLMPDGIGGTFSTWTRGGSIVGNVMLMQTQLSRVDPQGSATARPVSPGFWLELIGQAGTTIAFDGGWIAFDAATGETKWTRPLPALSPLAARPDGGLALFDWRTGGLAMTNANGDIESTQPFGLHWSAAHAFGDWIGLRDNQLAAVAGDFTDATRWSATGGNEQKQLATRHPGVGLWLKSHNAFGPFTFQHVSLRVTPINEEWLLTNRARFEQCQPGESCVPLGQDEYGNYFFTVGAGAGTADTNLQCNGILTKGFNRVNDVRTAPTAPLRQVPIDPLLQPILINSVLARADAYRNLLAYHCFPEEHPGFYNSNSFTHGLLHAAGLSHDELPPTPSRAPGWATPVPIGAFFGQQK